MRVCQWYWILFIHIVLTKNLLCLNERKPSWPLFALSQFSGQLPDVSSIPMTNIFSGTGTQLLGTAVETW